MPFPSQAGAKKSGAATVDIGILSKLAVSICCVLIALVTLAPSPATSATTSPSILSTSQTNPFGVLLSAPPCTGSGCTAVVNSCSGSDCHDITNSCAGSDCTLPVYVNTQVPACLEDTASGANLGCFPAGISAIPDFKPAATGSSLVLREQAGGFLAKLFLSSAAPPAATLSATVNLPNYQNCANVPPPASICDGNSCTLTKSIYVTSASPTSCTLPYPYPLDLNGYSLQGDANTQIYFNNTITNSLQRKGTVLVTNVTVILPNLTTPAFLFTAGSGQYGALFSHVGVYNGSYGIFASNIQLTVQSSTFSHSQVGIAVAQSGNMAGRYVHIYGSSFQNNSVGLQMQSDWPRDRFVTVWQQNPYDQCDASGTCFQDPVYSGAAYPPDFAAAPMAPYTKTYSASSAVWYPSGIQVVGNFFSNIGQYAANIGNAKEALFVSNQVSQFAGTAFRVFKSKNPTFNSNQISSAYLNYATVGIDLEYCDYQGVTHNQIAARTGIANHNYGGQYRNTTGIYYNSISADVGIEGVWDQVNTITPANSQEAWTSLMSDDEAAGNNFSAFIGGASSPYYTPATSFANQAVANVPSVTQAGVTTSYPIYPYDRIVDPFAQVLCGRAPDQRVNHFMPIIEAPPQCSLIGQKNVANTPTWVGNYYAGRMTGNAIGSSGALHASSNPYPNNFYKIPVWSVSAPFNMCMNKSVLSVSGATFSSYQSDYMPSVKPISYAGICNLGSGTMSLAQLLPGAQPAFPPPTSTTSQYGTLAQGVLNSADGQDNCGMNFPRAEFPSACSAN